MLCTEGFFNDAAGRRGFDNRTGLTVGGSLAGSVFRAVDPHHTVTPAPGPEATLRFRRTPGPDVSQPAFSPVSFPPGVTTRLFARERAHFLRAFGLKKGPCEYILKT